MSTDLQHEVIPPLAWDHNEQPFRPPPEAVAWRVRRYTGAPGRPPGVWTRHGILHVGLDSTIEHLRSLVKEPGSYRLYPIDKAGTELAPVACIEIVALERESKDASEGSDDEEDDEYALEVHGGPNSMLAHGAVNFTATQNRLFDTYDRMLASRDKHDELMGQMLTTLVTTTAQIQQSTANLLAAANTTVNVASGIEAIERQEPPQLDVQTLATNLTKVMGENKSQPPIWLQLLNGPLGMQLMSFAQSFATTMAAAAQANNSQEPKSEPEPAKPAADNDDSTQE